MKSIIKPFIFLSLIAFLSIQVPTSMAQEEFFVIVEEMPSFPGGEDAMREFIIEHLKYPNMAKESGISGTVYISFVIEADGRVNEVKVVKDIGGGCGAEALRVVKMMPNWKPGYQRGKPVRVKISLPVKFVLEDNAKKKKKRRQ